MLMKLLCCFVALGILVGATGIPANAYGSAPHRHHHRRHRRHHHAPLIKVKL